MTDTPETDAVLNQFEHHLPNWLAREIMAAVARRLERERDAFEKELAYVRDVLLDAMPNAHGSTKKLAEMLVQERDEAYKLERERDELRKALSLAGKLCHEVHHSKSMQHGDLDPYSVEALIQRARNQDS